MLGMPSRRRKHYVVLFIFTIFYLTPNLGDNHAKQSTWGYAVFISFNNKS